jgi:uncharacterized membrane protein YvlD (DUF360 family)
VAGAVLGVVNFIVKPIVKLLALPVILLTLGSRARLRQPADARHHLLG